ncbi:YwqJ-related putative deaminase, partial [Thermoactinomyces sp. DSM 45892]|uniref:YwqJ-related putative deaminase n=1 Tax=Thermoactinomyces sp. DSM 45892 TaxID=1882753 RepID=UPI00089BC648
NFINDLPNPFAKTVVQTVDGSTFQSFANETIGDTKFGDFLNWFVKGEGGNSSQALDETILPKGVNDDILKSRGFSKQELDSLVKYVNDEASALKNSGLTKKQLGAAVAATFDKKSGKYYTAINDMTGKIPKELHPLIDSKITGMPSMVKDSYIKTHGSGSHAEVYAINKALLDGANPKDLMTYVVKSGGTVKPLGDPFPMCPHCSHILQDFFVVTN